jgi:non-heme chloroperoxidase
MKAMPAIAAIAMILSSAIIAQPASPPDTSPHKVKFVTVDKDVKLEVSDRGGNGPPMIFLVGLGDMAHAFDASAAKFADHHHVYRITDRGFGSSDASATEIFCARLRKVQEIEPVC